MTSNRTYSVGRFEGGAHRIVLGWWQIPLIQAARYATKAETLFEDLDGALCLILLLSLEDPTWPIRISVPKDHFTAEQLARLATLGPRASLPWSAL